MELVTRVIGPLQTNVHLVGDPRTREAIAIDAAIPGLPWITGELEGAGMAARPHRLHPRPLGPRRRERGAASVVARCSHGSRRSSRRTPALSRPRNPAWPWSAPDGQAHRPDPSGGAEIAAHPADWHRLLDPQPLFAPFPIPACVPAAELAEGGVIRFGDVRLEVLHTPGHTEGSVCLISREAGILFSGDTLFTGGWGRVDLPGGDPDAMVDSLRRLVTLPDALRVLPGHGDATTIARERAWLEMVAREGQLPM